mmetsp:Transcript_118657/g.177362  ORF Transcript_118657/g.177362 Transcript_118657/m.177362 type:complete len:144 (+) Transcript_118657:155-586(+)
MRLYRLLRCRMKPRFKKQVDGKAQIIVGILSEEEFSLYLERLSSSVRPTKVRELQKKIPGFDAFTKQPESLLIAEWNNGVLPHLSHRYRWAFVKWLDRDTNEVFRSYATQLSVTHNSYTCCVRIGFSYVTSFYCESQRKWKKV